MAINHIDSYERTIISSIKNGVHFSSILSYARSIINSNFPKKYQEYSSQFDFLNMILDLDEHSDPSETIKLYNVNFDPFCDSIYNITFTYDGKLDIKKEINFDCDINLDIKNNDFTLFWHDDFDRYSTLSWNPTYNNLIPLMSNTENSFVFVGVLVGEHPAM